MALRHRLGAADILDDLQAAPAGLDLEILRKLLVGLGDPATDIPRLADRDARAVMGEVVHHQLGVGGEIAAMLPQKIGKVIEILVDGVAVEAHAAQDVAAFQRRPVDRKAGAVGAAMRLSVHHLHEVASDATGGVQYPPGDSAHFGCPPLLVYSVYSMQNADKL